MPDESPQRKPGHHDVFISYAQEDKPVADAVCAKLESRNIRCWIAPRDIAPGKSFPEAIIEGIEQGKVVVLIFSSFANKSPHVARELTNAVNKGRIIIPFRIEDVIPSKTMEYLIGVPHWLDAVTPPLERHIELLAGTIESILGTDQKPDSCLEPAASTISPQPVATLEEENPAPVLPKQPLPQPVRQSGGFSSGQKTVLSLAGILVVAALVVFFAVQAGVLSLPGLNSSPMKNGVPGTNGASPSETIDYQSSDIIVNTVAFTAGPTQTLAKDTELYVDASKDNTNAMVTIQFNGGPGMGLVKDNQVILTRSDGTVTEGKLNFNQRLSEVKLQGTRGTDRIQVRVTLYSGATKTIVDKLLLYRTYRGE